MPNHFSTMHPHNERPQIDQVVIEFMKKVLPVSINDSFWSHESDIEKYILDGTVEGLQPCWYCGMCNCSQSKFSCPNKKKGKHFFQKVDINCPFFYMHTAWRLENRKKRKIVCTNYLIKGTQCKADTWYYNILVPSHFSIMHLINEWPHIHTAEIELMKKNEKLNDSVKTV